MTDRQRQLMAAAVQTSRRAPLTLSLTIKSQSTSGNARSIRTKGIPDAVDLAMQAQAKYYLPDSKATVNDAVTLSEHALALDPQNVDALVTLEHRTVI